MTGIMWAGFIGPAGQEYHISRSHLKGFELQRECRQCQFQMFQFSGARVLSMLHGETHA
jgi:hypothetical protein